MYLISTAFVLLTLSQLSIQIPLYTKITQDFSQNFSNKICYDTREYYTITTIKNYSILYTVNKTNTILIKYPSYSILENLIHSHKNITFHAIVDIDYNILTPCLYKCKMMIISDNKYNYFITENFQKLFKIGGDLHMFCNSKHCKWGNIYCETYNVHDEL
jgi:hypothetical protein